MPQGTSNIDQRCDRIAMVYKPGYLRERSKELINARKLAITAGTGFLALGLFASKLMEILGGAIQMIDFGHIALLAMTSWLIFSWIWSSQRELNLLFEWLDPERYEPPSTIMETILILTLGVLLAGLLFAAKDPRWYALVFTAYSLANILANKKVQSEVGDAISKSKDRAQKDLENKDLVQKARLYLKGLQILERYYVLRHHGLLTLITLIFSSIGLLVSLAWWLTGSDLVGFTSYAIFLLILVVTQVTIWHWRIVRDVGIRPIKAELNELTRFNEERLRTDRR
jgi:membrane protein implicated in regulation of membrane protease activity